MPLVPSHMGSLKGHQEGFLDPDLCLPAVCGDLILQLITVPGAHPSVNHRVLALSGKHCKCHNGMLGAMGSALLGSQA